MSKPKDVLMDLDAVPNTLLQKKKQFDTVPLEFVSKTREGSADISLYVCSEAYHKTHSTILFKVVGMFDQPIDICKSALLNDAILKCIDPAIKEITEHQKLNDQCNFRTVISELPGKIFKDIEVNALQCTTDTLIDQLESDDKIVPRVVRIYTSSDLYPKDLNNNEKKKQPQKNHNKRYVVHNIVSVIELKPDKADKRTSFSFFSALQLPPSTLLDWFTNPKDIGNLAKEKLIRGIHYFRSK